MRLLPKSRKVNLIKCHTFSALKICSDNKIKSEFEQFRNNIRPFDPFKFPVYVRFTLIGSPSQLIAGNFSSVTCYYNAAMVRTIFTSRAAFCSTHKDVLLIFQQSNLIYKFQCCSNPTYIGRISQRLEVRVKHNVPRDIRNHTISAHSKLLDSAICEHFNALNSCAVHYNDEYLGVLHNAKRKQHLIVLESLHILLFDKFYIIYSNFFVNLETVGIDNLMCEIAFLEIFKVKELYILMYSSHR